MTPAAAERERLGSLVEPVDPARFTTLARMVRSERHRLVVSFGGGAVPGLAGNVALAYLLEQLELRDAVEEVWGTSAGAITAGSWASGTPALEVLRIVCSLNRRGSVDIAWWQLGVALLLRPFGRNLPDGIMRGRAFRRAIAESLAAETIEACPIPVRLIAVRDDGSMRRTVFRRGPMLPAILASMAIPGLMMPEPVQPGETYYDGGLLEKTPLLSPVAEHARSGSEQQLLLLGTHFDNEVNKTAAKGFLQRFLQTIYAMEDVCWNYQLAEVRRREDVTLLLVNPKLLDPSLFDFASVEENFVASHAAYVEQLQNANLALTLGGD